jgi:hypothetical protein
VNLSSSFVPVIGAAVRSAVARTVAFESRRQ